MARMNLPGRAILLRNKFSFISHTDTRLPIDYVERLRAPALISLCEAHEGLVGESLL